MHTTKNIEKFRENQLKLGINSQASWHKDYDSAYIFIGNLNYGMNQGDIAIVFSQFGEIVDVHLARDKVTGKSKGFCFLAYQDQRSTVLAVDNFNGCNICGRVIQVDHVKKYKPPKEFMDVKDQMEAPQYKPTGPDGKGWGKYRIQSQLQIEAMKKHQKAKQQKRIMTEYQLGRR